MTNINTITLTGGLPRDAELHTFQNGSSVANFSLGFSTYLKGINERNEKPNYIDCSLYGNQATTLTQYLKKGTKVALSGRIEQQSWTEQTGSVRSKIIVNVDSIQLLGSPQQQTQNQVQQNAPSQQIPENVQMVANTFGGTVSVDNGEIPF